MCLPGPLHCCPASWLALSQHAQRHLAARSCAGLRRSWRHTCRQLVLLVAHGLALTVHAAAACAWPRRCPQEWEYLLEELALWFLLYSEGANLRHVPEAMWFLYWCMRNSHEKQMQITVPPPTDQRSAAFIGEAAPACMPGCRRRFLRTGMASCQLDPDATSRVGSLCRLCRRHTVATRRT